MAKKFYFVRHGESEGNVTDIHHDPAGALTEHGREQARFLGKRFKTIPVDVILASHYERAQETAHIIAEHISKSIETVPLLAEHKMPSVMIGLPPDHPVRVELKQTPFEAHFDENSRHSDEENFADIKNRALQLLAHLLERNEESLLLVSHGWFLRIVIGVMLHGENLKGPDALLLWKFLATKNTGITVCEYDENNRAHGWRLITWNDHAHLGDA